MSSPRIYGFTEKQLEIVIDKFEEMTLREIRKVSKTASTRLGGVVVAQGAPEQEETASVSMNDIAVITTLWSSAVASELVPYVRDLFKDSADVIRRALSYLIPAVVDTSGFEIDDSLDNPSGTVETVTERMAQSFIDGTLIRLNSLGTHLWEHAQAELLEGFNNGESIDQLQKRIVNAGGLTEARARVIARTEAISAANAGAVEQMKVSGFQARKEWIATNDTRTRPTHTLVDGNEVLLNEKFIVGGAPLDFPGDPAGPLDEIINCRCTVSFSVLTEEEERELSEAALSASAVEAQTRMPRKLRSYWLRGPGAAKIGWGSPGDFTRCVRQLRKYFPTNTEGLCANLHHEATGMWPGDRRNK